MFESHQRAQLLNLVRQALNEVTQAGSVRDKVELDRVLMDQNGACFVTLLSNGSLRGCIGSLTAYRPLNEDVIGNAQAAAFRDPRFAPLQADELDSLDIELSILSLPEPIHFDNEDNLLQQLRPNIDGLVLIEKGHRGTFLPSVWRQLPSREQFLRHLKQKAGLPPTYWSESIQIQRYTTESFGAPFRL
jgi:uncharacterized protein